MSSVKAVTQGWEWDGMPYRNFLDRLKTIPQLLFRETPYQYITGTIWITMRVNALSREVWFSTQKVSELFVGGSSSAQTGWRSSQGPHTAPQTLKLDLGQGPRDREGKEEMEEKGDESGREGGERKGQGSTPELLFPLPALSILLL